MKKLLSEYVYKPLQLLCDFFVANNAFSNNFKYTHDIKPHNSFESMNVNRFYGNSVSFKV